MLREADDAKASLYGTINFHVTRNNYLAAKPLAAFNNTREQPICEANHCFFMYEWEWRMGMGQALCFQERANGTCAFVRFCSKGCEIGTGSLYASSEYGNIKTGLASLHVLMGQAL